MDDDLLNRPRAGHGECLQLLRRKASNCEANDLGALFVAMKQLAIHDVFHFGTFAFLPTRIIYCAVRLSASTGTGAEENQDLAFEPPLANSCLGPSRCLASGAF